MRGTAVLNYISHAKISESRDAIKLDLAGKIIYDDPAVFRRLRIDQVNDDIVATCAASFKVENEEDIHLLKGVIENASKKTVEMLELEEGDDIAQEAEDMAEEAKKPNAEKGMKEEKKMYDPLVRIFTYIANFGQDHAPRKFLKTKGELKPDEHHALGFTGGSPDLNLVPEWVNPSKSKLWRDRDGFVEVKPSEKQRPKPATLGTITPIVTQSADYARLLMSARPFMLFCVGLQIFGSKFSIGIFDRDGVTFSPAYDMFDDTETLIRVVRTLACNLSIVQLGFDPTVRILSDEETQRLAGPTATYPSAVVSSCGRDPSQRQWCTIGPPIWISPSLMGRGTCIWRDRQYVEGVDQQWSFLKGLEMIMKTTWRRSDRTAEADIYLSIGRRPPPGLAEFECGGDVKFAGYPITINNLRNNLDQQDLSEDEGSSNPPTPVLHRLLFRTVGLPLWNYTSERNLFTGFRDAIRAHRSLCLRGVLHRDITAGNVMLNVDETPTALFRGFITDLESASLQGSTLMKLNRKSTIDIGPVNKYDDRGHIVSITEKATNTHFAFESRVTVKRGVIMSGSAQFAAWELLQAIIYPTPTLHEARHDVESFIWVFSYCVMRNLYHKACKKSAPKEVQKQWKSLQNAFDICFGQTTYKQISSERLSGSSTLSFPRDPNINAIVKEFMSDTLVDFFTTLQVLVYKAQAPTPLVSTALTHDALLTVVENALLLLPV